MMRRYVEEESDGLSSTFNPLELWDDNEEEERVVAALAGAENDDDEYNDDYSDVWLYDEEKFSDSDWEETPIMEQPVEQERQRQQHQQQRSPVSKKQSELKEKKTAQPRKPESPVVSSRQQQKQKESLPTPIAKPSDPNVPSSLAQPGRARVDYRSLTSHSPLVRQKTKIASRTTDSNTNLAKSGRTTPLAASVPSGAAPKVNTRSSKPLSATRSGTITPWVQRYCESHQRESLLVVPREYLADGFNLVQLPLIVERFVSYPSPPDPSFPIYKAALRLLLSMDESELASTSVSTTSSSTTPPPPPSPSSAFSSAQIESATEILYLLVHARYIASPRGLETVHRMLLHDATVFGKCPRVCCRGMPLLPYGASDLPGGEQSQRYCCLCGEIFHQWTTTTDAAAAAAVVDGCGWGPSFCHLLLLTYGTKLAERLCGQLLPKKSQFEQQQATSAAPSVFGFVLHPAARPNLQ